MTETWKAVPGFEGLYEVSDMGRVRSLDRVTTQLSKWGSAYALRKRGRILRPGKKPSGHVSVALGRGNSQDVHILVLEAFVGAAPYGMEARHLNDTPYDNRLCNLEWNTRGRNAQDKKWFKGARTYKLSPQDVMEIKSVLAKKLKRTTLAADFRVSPSTISCIKHGRTHRDVEC